MIWLVLVAGVALTSFEEIYTTECRNKNKINSILSPPNNIEWMAAHNFNSFLRQLFFIGLSLDKLTLWNSATFLWEQ